jgi:dTDP-4-amino-4,6-dideoxygalactose transaminase
MKFYDAKLSKLEIQHLIKITKGVIERGDFIGGREVKELEERLSTDLNARFMSCGSGTSALHLALLALGVGKGDEVITTPFTFFAVIEAIYHVGARPVLADIDPKTFNIDPDSVERKLTKTTKAILPVHLFGLSCDMDGIMEIARSRKLLVVEDVAQAFGAKYKGELLGTIGNAGCFSFFPTKNLWCVGDGGGATFKKSRNADKFQSLRNHGQKVKYTNLEMGHNSRLDTLKAALLLYQVKRMKMEFKRRAENAKAWIDELKDDPEVLQLPTMQGHTYNQFSIIVKNRSRFEEKMKKRGVPYMVYYDKPVYRQPAWIKYYGRHKSLANAEYAARHIIGLPILK